jgi:hypothetical protein
MWLAGTRPVLCAVVAIEGNRGRGARRWPQTRAPGHPVQACDPGRVVLDAWSWTRRPWTRSPDAWPQALFPGKRDYTVLAPLRSRSGDNRFLGLQTGIAVTARGTGGQIPARPGRLSRPATW